MRNSPADRCPMTPALALALAAWAGLVLLVRLYGVNWDAGAALNPDARHLYNLASAAAPRIETALAEGVGWWRILFDPAVSPLNPQADGGFYVYGELPLTALTLIGHFGGFADYADFILAARVLAALVFATSVLAVAISARIAGAPAGGVMAAAMLFATAPTAFQIAGFGAVDIWLVAAWAWAGAGMLALALGPVGGGGLALATGAAIGTAVSTKLTGFGLGLPALLCVALILRRDPVAGLRLGALGLIGALAAMRLLSPMSFAGLLAPAPELLADFAELRGLAAVEHFPPNWHWQIPVSAAARLRDLLLFGTGPVLAAAVLLGLLRARGGSLAMLLALAAVPALHLALAYNPALRYGAPALPALAVLAGIGLGRAPRAVLALALCAALWWVSGLVRLHLSEHSRIAASRWLLAQPGPRLVIVESFWDDPLPVRIPGLPGRADFTTEALVLEAAPDADKVARIVDLASRGDFIVSASGRFAEVLPHLADRYPVAAAWFAGLESGAFCLRPVWQARPGYPLPGLRFDDSMVQEPWTVYDHPPVTVYVREDCFDAEALERALTAALR